MRRWKPYKYLHIGPYGLGALCLIALATTLRIVLILNWPVLNSDEGTMGLMALHIVNQGKIPVFFYGQGYIGSLEAILAAPLFRLFGPSDFTLRLGLVFLYALFLLNMYLLTSTLYTKRLALFTLLLLSFGPTAMLALQVSAIGGYPDTLFFASLLLLYALVLARSAGETPLTQEQRPRILSYAGWSLVAGLALWSDPLLIPYVVLSGWLLWRFCRREMSRPVVLWMLFCFILPLIPAVIYNFTVPLNLSTFAFLGAAFWVHGTTLEVAPPLVRIAGMLFVALPRTTGANVLGCNPHSSVWPLFPPQNASAAACTIENGLWGAVFIILLIITAVLAYKSYRPLKRAMRLQPWTQEQRREMAGYFAQLMLVGSTLLILIVYTSSSSAGLDPWGSTRYLTTALIALPSVLWPIWRAGTNIKRKLLANGVKALRAALLLVVFLSFTLGWVQTLNFIPAARDAERREADFIHTLLNRGITHIYTDYWTCDRIVFESTERIICSVVDEQLRPGVNRYTPYTAIVNADSRASWVFPLGSAQARVFEQNMQKSGETNPSFTRDGYVIYLPITHSTGGQYKSSLLKMSRRIAEDREEKNFFLRMPAMSSIKSASISSLTWFSSFSRSTKMLA